MERRLREAGGVERALSSEDARNPGGVRCHTTKKLAERVRAVLGGHPALVEKKMFGGVCFLLQGNMACGISNDELMVRVGVEGAGEALADANARPMDLTGRPMRRLGPRRRQGSPTTRPLNAGSSGAPRSH